MLIEVDSITKDTSLSEGQMAKKRVQCVRVFTADDYLEMLRQLGQRRLSPMSPLGVGATLLRARHPTDEGWSLRYEKARPIVDAMTAVDRLDPAELDAGARSRSASISGQSPREIDRLIRHFEEARETIRTYEQSGLWMRLKLILRSDPILSRLARGLS